MNTKLTLRMDDSLIRAAKEYAKQRGKSVSRIVGEYFLTLGVGQSDEYPITPIAKSLRGVLKGHDLDREDYRRHLEQKYF